MERYSGTRPMEAMPVDPVGEWAAPGGETGLEEPMWQLGLGGGPESYPERPDEPDCIYYLRTGFCGYGNRCRFNHPPDRSSAMGALRAGGAELPERVGQPICQYYMRTGLCKFGASCKYHHPKHGSGSSGPITLNFYGYPLRPGEKECSYYIKTGQCKFGVTCKFHHPQPAGIQAPAAYPTAPSPVQSSQQYGAIPGNWPIARPAMIPGSYVPGSYGHVVLPVPGWTPYPAPISPAGPQSSQTNVGAGSIYVMPQLSPSAAAYTGQYLSTSAGPSSSTQKEHASFPERPGQPECQYYLRTGDCKFGSTCKYHHPPEWTASRTKFSLSAMGLPLRPGAPLCSHYSQSGICKFGPSCKFDHPMRILSYSPSASSLTDMPVAPYPVGSANASASVGSIFSNSGPAPQSSSIQQSGAGSTSSSGGEVRSEVRSSS